MADLFDYLDWRGDIGFEAVGVTPVDGLIFSALAYVHYDGLVREDFTHPVPLEVVADAFAVLPDKAERVLLKNDGRLLQAAAGTERYRHVELVFYRSETVPELESQFAAVAFLLPNGQAVLAFRGTDATLVGWKEDFNMSFQPCVPAQEKALYYTQTFAGHHDHPLILCGHSKGGNLALYAAAMCRPETQEKIDCAVSFDGPGLNERIIHSEGFARMQEHMRVILPRDSLVGRLFEQPDNIRIVDSRVFSLLQHYPYFWKTRGMDFIDIERPGRLSAILGQSLCGLMERLDAPSREQLIESVYDILSASEADTFNDFASSWLKSSAAVVSKLFHTDSQTRRLFQRAINAFFTSAAQVIGERRRSD